MNLLLGRVEEDSPAARDCPSASQLYVPRASGDPRSLVRRGGGAQVTRSTPRLSCAWPPWHAAAVHPPEVRATSLRRVTACCGAAPLQYPPAHQARVTAQGCDS
jgi:hypothetical protein